VEWQVIAVCLGKGVGRRERRRQRDTPQQESAERASMEWITERFHSYSPDLLEMETTGDATVTRIGRPATGAPRGLIRV
jgi:hypothetical protein